MPSRLRPTAPLAADAILVGDPGRALLLAQELLEEPKMSNHARGLWGYTGKTAGSRVDHRKRGSTRQPSAEEGRELTIQSTGMGGPSAALVLTDLAELGVRRAVRVGTCAAPGGGAGPGELLVVAEAIAAGGSAEAYGARVGAAVAPNAALTAALAAALDGEARAVTAASFDSHPATAELPDGIVVADMQTAPLLASAAALGIRAAAVLVVAEGAPGGEQIGQERLEAAAKRAGRAALAALSP